jgi:hypothetical protein
MGQIWQWLPKRSPDSSGEQDKLAKEKGRKTMKHLDPHDQASETLVYHSAVITQQYQDGLLSRLEAEVLDILHKLFSQGRQEENALAHQSAASDDLCVVLVRSGKVVSVLDLGAVAQGPTILPQRLAICSRIARWISTLLLPMFENED